MQNDPTEKPAARPDAPAVAEIVPTTIAKPAEPKVKRFVAQGSLVIDTQSHRYAPFGHEQGAALIAAELNVADPASAERFSWVDGDAPKPVVVEES